MQTEIKGSYYKSINDLPLNKFIDCIVDGNLSALIISGFPGEEELTEAWDAILSEYSELVGTQEYRMYVELFREVSLLKITLDQVTIATNILKTVYHPFFETEVNKLLRVKINFNVPDEQREIECKKCLNRSKALKIKLDLKNLQFEAIQKKNNAKVGEKIDRKYFTSILITLSDHAKYRIEETIKMSEYCERIRRFADHLEHIKKKT